MSVRVCDRKLSRLEVVYHATEVKDKIHELCIRNLAIKDMDVILRKKILYGLDPEATYEKCSFEINRAKKKINDYADTIVNCTSVANKIKMNSLKNCDRRLEYQERASDNCEILIGELQSIADTFFVDVNKYKGCVEAIDYEITLLKGWIKYTNQIRKRYL